MMKYVLSVCCLVLLTNMSLSAQVLDFMKDTLTTDEQKKAYFEKHKQEILQEVLKTIMLSAKGSGGSDDVKMQQRQDSIRKAVETKYKAGAPSADFKFKDVNGKVVSLKNLRGKYVYIDVWASWCSPCCKEIPFLQQLEEKMHGKKITFVSISWDRNRDNWVRALQEKNMKGVQLYFDNDDTFFKEYGIEFIPRFILLDKKGRVVNAYMTRPSDPKTEETLNALKGL